jgi:hypothetical protein
MTGKIYTITSNSNLILRSSKDEFKTLAHEKTEFYCRIRNMHYIYIDKS